MSASAAAIVTALYTSYGIMNGSDIMKVLLFNEGESLEEFEKISEAIIHDLVNLRGMPTDNGQYMRTALDDLKHEESNYEITLVVHRVKCSRHEDF